MSKFKVTEHFQVYGNRKSGGSRYNCKTCDWKGNAFETAQEHYEARHLGVVAPPQVEAITPEEASNALSYLAKRLIAVEEVNANLERRNGELLKALSGRNMVKLAEEVRKVYQPEVAKRG